MKTEEGFRALDATVHDLDTRARTVVVHIPHERLDSYRTDFAKDAFADSFRSRLPVLLREHDPRDRIGHATSAQSLALVNEIRGQFEPFGENPTAKRTFDDLRSGKLKGWSFFFRNAQATPHPTIRGATRYVRAEVPEFSAVARPSVPGTVTVELRSMAEADDLDAAIDAALDKIDRRLGIDEFAHIRDWIARDDRRATIAATIKKIDQRVHVGHRSSISPRDRQILVGRALRTIDQHGRTRR